MEEELQLLGAAVEEEEKDHQIVVEQDLVLILDIDEIVLTVLPVVIKRSYHIYCHLQRIWKK